MGFRLLLTYVIMKKIYADFSTEMIVDYFHYKKVPSVVGVSCNEDIGSDVRLIRQLSSANIGATIYRPGNQLVTQALQNNHWKVGVFINTKCLEKYTIASMFMKATDYRLYGDSHYWLIVTDSLNDTASVIDDRAFGLSTDFVVAETAHVNNLLSYKLFDAYNICKTRGSLLNISYFGQWNHRSHLNITLTQSKFDRRSNLNGLVLKVMFFRRSYDSVNESLESYLEDYQHATRDGRNKFGYHVLQHLGDLYNFTFISSESMKWKPGDTLGPLARALIDETADIAGTPLVMMNIRISLMKFVHQDWPFRTCFIFRNPQSTEIKIQQILRSFAPNVWYLIVATTMMGITALTVALHYDLKKFDTSKLSDSFLMVFGALCQQCSDIKIKRVVTRMVFFWMIVFSHLMYTYYSASVVSARIDEPIYKINDSLNELAKLRLKVASERMVYLDYLVKQQSDWETQKFYNNLWLKMPESERIMDPETGINLVRGGGFAYHLHPEVGYPIIEKTFNNREICELSEVHLGRLTYTSFSVTMNSSIVELMRIGLAKIAEVGLSYRQLQRWQYRKPYCRADILSVSSVKIDEFSPHLILMVIGITTATVVFTIEIAMTRYVNYSYRRGRVNP